MAISFGGKEPTYLSNFMLELGFKSFSSLPINCDSTDALHVAGNSTYSSKTKHIALRFEGGRITILHAPKQQMLTDCATKHLAQTQFGWILQQKKDFSC